jgi:hypothetical protein
VVLAGFCLGSGPDVLPLGRIGLEWLLLIDGMMFARLTTLLPFLMFLAIKDFRNTNGIPRSSRCWLFSITGCAVMEELPEFGLFLLPPGG